MHYFQFNIGDYQSHTRHLEIEDDIAFRRMMDLYYLHESPLPDNVEEIARLICMRTHCERIANVLGEFFTLDSDGYHLPRADKEIAAYRAKSKKAQKAANKRWSDSADKEEKGGDANALQTQSESNAKHKTLNIKHETSNNKLIPSVGYTDDDMKTAEWIWKRIVELQPNRKPPKLDKWADTIRLMRMRDNRSLSKICEVFYWANNDSFWKTIILSPDKLREKFDDLSLKMQQPVKTQTKPVEQEGDFIARHTDTSWADK